MKLQGLTVGMVRVLLHPDTDDEEAWLEADAAGLVDRSTGHTLASNGHAVRTVARRVQDGLDRSDRDALAELIRRSDDPHDDNSGGDGWIGFPDAECVRWRRLMALRIVQHAPVRHFGECGHAWWRPTPAGRLVDGIGSQKDRVEP